MTLSWADEAIRSLQNGEEVKLENTVSVIQGKLKKGHKVFLEPLDSKDINPGEIVLVRYNGKDFFREVEDLGKKKVLVGDTDGVLGGWVRKRDIFGKVINIEKK